MTPEREKDLRRYPSLTGPHGNELWAEIDSLREQLAEATRKGIQAMEDREGDALARGRHPRCRQET